jgi:molybdopterin converting factor small subunit
MEIETPCSVVELAAKIGIPSKDIGLYIIDQKIWPKDTLVNDGDTIEFYPHIEGG